MNYFKHITVSSLLLTSCKNIKEKNKFKTFLQLWISARTTILQSETCKLHHNSVNPIKCKLINRYIDIRRNKHNIESIKWTLTNIR